MQRITLKALVPVVLLLAGMAAPAPRAALAAAPSAPSTYTATPASVFINEFHYDNIGIDSNEFVEIAGPAGTDLTGWSVVLYVGSTGAPYKTQALAGSIPNLQSGFGVVSVSATGYRNGPDGIALVDASGSTVQFLSYEGSFTAASGPASGLTSTDVGVSEPMGAPIGSSLRLTGVGSTYADFTWASPAPNTRDAINTGQTFTGGAVVDEAPTVAEVNPAPDATEVAPEPVLTVTFSEEVSVAEGWFSIQCADGGSIQASYSGGGATYSIDPEEVLLARDTCTVTVHAAGVADTDNGSTTPLAADYSWSFTVAILGFCGDGRETRIHEIQGSGGFSPMTGRPVAIEGVVVGDFQGNAPALGGFFVQEEDAHRDIYDSTSEGIFVFDQPTFSTPAGVNVSVGDVVRVEGGTVEFGTVPDTLTQLGSVTRIVICSSGAAVTPASISLPVESLEFWESVEGMLVEFPQELSVTENRNLGSQGEVLLSSGGRLLQPTQAALPGAAAQAIAQRNTRNRILLDDAQVDGNPEPILYPEGGLSAGRTLRQGDMVSGLTGILDQRFDLYRIQPRGPVAFTLMNSRPSAPDRAGSKLRIASFSLDNYFDTVDQDGAGCGPTGNLPCPGADNGGERSRQRAKIVSALIGLDADIVALTEIENDDDTALADLIFHLNFTLGSDTYAFVPTGMIGGDATKVAIIYRHTVAAPVGSPAILSSAVEPRYDDVRNQPAVAQSFRQNSGGGLLTVVALQLATKDADCSDIGDIDLDDGQGNCNVTRINAIAALGNWLQTDPTGSGSPHVLLLGDFNAYAQEDPIRILTGAGYVSLPDASATPSVSTFDSAGPQLHSVVVDGQAGTLNYAFASPSLAPRVERAGLWHINSDEPAALDYNEEGKSPTQLVSLYSQDAYRSAQSDPIYVDFCIDTQPPVLTVSATPNSLWPANHAYVRVQTLVSVDDPTAALSLVSVVSSDPDSGMNGDDIPNDIVILDDMNFDLRAERQGGNAPRAYTITYQAIDECGNVGTGAATVTVPGNQSNAGGNGDANGKGNGNGKGKGAKAADLLEHTTFLPMISGIPNSE